ncbi:MAG: hypothetical protein KKD05_08915 [Candidatus Omnitrophica bacterium]|nr:hypothetical protein [Candidatus Omnitrophota bacterium]
MKNSCFLIVLISLIVCANPWVFAQEGLIPESEPAKKAGQAIELKQQIVYSDKDAAENSFFPSQTIGDGPAIEFDQGWQENPQSGSTCVKIKYNATGDFGWAGLYWVNPVGNWGQKKGGYDLRFAKKLTFWAKGEKGGEHIAVFRLGGLKGTYPDSDNHGIGPVVLTPEWKQYAVDVSQRNLKYIFAGFSFALTKAHNRKGCIFYLDNIKYE